MSLLGLVWLVGISHHLKKGKEERGKGKGERGRERWGLKCHFVVGRYYIPTYLTAGINHQILFLFSRYPRARIP